VRIRGDLANDTARLPRVPGHEIVGRVDAVGPGVSTPQVGPRVMAYFYLVCERCEACRAGDDSFCRNLAGWVGVHRDGGYAPFTVLPAGNAVPLPDSIPAPEATAIPDAVARVVGGGGGVGVHMVAMAALFGGRVAGSMRMRRSSTRSGAWAASR
jgi:D-arabinose 1-dehydrogenase-like Zn-dependent alcohol dehydrogenase